MEREIEKNESLAQIKDMLSGIIAGGTSKIIEYPLDTVKVLCQINEQKSLSTFNLTRNLIKNEGITRIYRGLSAPLCGSCLEYFTTFWMFGAAERYIKSYTNKNQLSLFEIGLAGAFSGVGIGFVLTPVEYIKCQMQAQHTARHYSSTWNCLRYHLGRNPFRLFTGLHATLLREIPGTAVYFWAYRGTTRTLQWITDKQDTDPSNWMVLIGGGMAGLSFWSTFYPIDLIKSHIQTQECSTLTTTSVNNMNTVKLTPIKTNIMNLLINRVQRHGILSLYRGFSVTIPRAIISNSCIFFVYEGVRNYLDTKM